MSALPETVDGYVADSLYPSSVHQPFSPPWTDALLVHAGVRPPRRARTPFTLVDLGCGDGAGLALLAAAHPEAQFIGVDALPGHIEKGRSLISEWGLSNITLHHATFDTATALLLPECADYVACQGVLAWVSAANRAALLDLAARILRPGGALTIGYNCFPGWTQMTAFQHAVRAMAEGRPGTPVARFEAAVAALRANKAMPQTVWGWLDPLLAKLPPDYFAHEYLNAHWSPLWAEDAIRAFAACDLHCVSEARPWRLRPDFALKQAWREALDGVDDPALRETLRDILTHNWFRTDICVKGLVERLDEDARTQQRLNGYWASTQAAEGTAYHTRTAAGTIRFDNDAARAIMALLEDGPAPLAAVSGLDGVDLLNTIDALFMAGLVMPLDPPAAVPAAARVNARVRAMDAAGGLLNGLVGRNGLIGLARGEVSQLSAQAATRYGLAD